MDILTHKILGLMNEAETKAWASLCGYKFWMFGYHAAAWVKYNQLLDEPLPNPFKELVKSAQGK
ncbi:hypothetical protein LCGC14_0732910 [marine sediment metagenome]|uniref:Uncharacterized protein n=1 Tax=marine sediment metagenome TaxID=412755 RepID=A0A0F9QU04_9ZZZZ